MVFANEPIIVPSRPAGPAANGGARPSLLLFALFLSIAFLLSLYPRVDQYQVLYADRPTDEEVMVPTASADSYFWFRLAREYAEGVDFGGVDRLRHFPAGAAYESLPPLSWLIATTADLLGTDIYRAGLLLSVLLSSLFVIPLGLYGWQTGYPVAGILGALLASFSAGFFHRSSVQRVDTDGGNLFFVWVIALFMATLQPGQSVSKRIFTAAASGFAVNAFCVWYAQTGFWLVYLATFILVVLALRSGWATSLFLVAVYVLCANPLQFVAGLEGLRAFVVDYLMAARPAVGDVAQNGLVFPDVTVEIQELERYGFWRALRGTLANPLLALLGLAGFVSFVATRWQRLLPLLPTLALAILGFIWASRFVMYAAPLVGFGLGYLLSFAVSTLAYFLVGHRRHRRPALVGEILVYAAACVLLYSSLGSTAFASRPKVSFDRPLIASLEEMRRILPPGAAIASSWSYGYLLTDVTGAATFDDGRDPNDVIQQLLARGLTSDRPEELADILTYLSGFGRARVGELVEASASYPDLLAEISRQADRVGPDRAPVYLLFLERMLHREFSTYHYQGQWDFDAGKGTRDGFGIFNCKKKDVEILSCRSRRSQGFDLDLETGRVNHQSLLRRIVKAHRGEAIWERTYESDAELTFEWIEAEASDEGLGLLLREGVYASNFNQMFVLGRFDPRLFAEFHNNFPVARSFELLRLPLPADGIPRNEPTSLDLDPSPARTDQ